MRKPITPLFLVLFLLLSFSIGFASPVNTFHITGVELSDNAGLALDSTQPTIIPFSGEYIGNSNSGIFHYSYCRYVGRMSENHKVFFDSRDEAIDAGYRPCKVCRP